MNVVSENNKILKASVSLLWVDDVFGLVMESRGGAIGKPNARNTDYLDALDTILKRLQSRGVTQICIHVVSLTALKIWGASERAIEIGNSSNISLIGVDATELRKKISKAQQNKKEDPSSKGGNPTKRILIEADLSEESWQEVVLGLNTAAHQILEDEIHVASQEFLPEDAEKAKEKVARSVALRRGQPAFRNKLLSIYAGACAITGTRLPQILEAAHIVPYRGEKTNHVTNGILLRADIHTLFDLGLLGVDQNYKVVVSKSLQGSEYEKYNGQKIALPANKAEQPSLPALKSRPLPS